MKKQNFLLFLLCSSINLSIFCAEIPQPSYWQRFKNWITGASVQTQEMTKSQYEWAKNYVTGLTESQKLALRATLIALPMTFGLGMAIESLPSKKPLDKYMFGTISAYLLFDIINNILKEYGNKKDIIYAMQDTIKHISNKQDKIDALKLMQIAYMPTGIEPNKTKLEAVNTVLNELLIESK